jgi:galactose mutarotase-like enzyme
MFTIENQSLKVTIEAKGAELTSIHHKDENLDYLWGGDPAIWGKHSPVLFPIVGALKDNAYYYNNVAYHLPRHGFARDRVFAMERQTDDTVVLLLTSDAETMQVFPFEFELRIRYTLFDSSLAVAYHVKNTGPGDMFFSLGAHPAFKLPLNEDVAYSDYYIVFDKVETAPRWPISPEGLIMREPVPLLGDSNRLPLTKELFHKDAIVLKGIDSSILTVKSDKAKNGFRFDFPGFPYLGIWAAKNADFVCIEPWCGIADGVDTDQQLDHKEGINKLQKDEEFTRTWTVSFF